MGRSCVAPSGSRLLDLSTYDPVERHLTLERLLTKLDGEVVARKYWRFRPDRWYGGVATADCVGCGLACKFCWVKSDVLYNPAGTGSFHKPCDVASKLKSIAISKGYRQARLSGGEPTISKSHLTQLLRELDSFQPLDFILETNGILLGHSREYASELSEFNFLHVRVSLKGCDEAEFRNLTGASPIGFKLQIDALRNLVDEGVSCHPAVMRSFSSPESFQHLKERLSEIAPELAGCLEVEEVIMYPRVAERMSRIGLKPKVSCRPGKVPKYLV
ncbi:radical SAM protein [Candidatus Bathyarchaeota archaeon]|nr:radical SAM protein [Candidatus Bathyarchaeota archaeon]